jgi:hypothetical protein
MDSFSRALLQEPAETFGIEAGEIWREMAVKFAHEVSSSISVGFFNMS